MQHKLYSLALVGVAALGLATAVNAQQFTLSPVTGSANVDAVITSGQSLVGGGIQSSLQTIGTGLPTFNYTTVAAQDGLTYNGVIVGRDPHLRGKIPVTIPAVIIPVRFHFRNAANTADSFVFDPDAPDGCQAGLTTTNLVMGSPILNNAPAPIFSNGTNVGATQYVDATQRAEFWTLINGANYHTLLAPSLRPTVDVNVPSGLWGVNTTHCHVFGGVDINAWDSFVQGTLLPFEGVNSSQFPMIIDADVAYTINGGCCALGYHNAYGAGQTYSSSDFDTSGFFPPSFDDTVVLSHEVSEWMNDPFVNNPTPAWGNIGQVTGCQGNLETGDPLTPINAAPIFMNGFNYHVQELTFFSWFYGGASLGTGGKYSSNGTFGGDAKLCPPGGTN